MSERDVLVVTNWVYDDDVFAVLREELAKPYPRSLRGYEDRVLLMNDAAPGMVVFEVREALERTAERCPQNGLLKLVVMPEDGPPVFFNLSRGTLTEATMPPRPE